MTDLFDTQRVIDVDTHLTEPPDTWTRSFPLSMHDKVPHIERIDGRDVAYRVGAAGRHWATNSLAVLAAAQALGSDLDAAAAALAAVSAPKGRGQQRRIALAGSAGADVRQVAKVQPADLRAAVAVLPRVAGHVAALEPGAAEAGADRLAAALTTRQWAHPTR